MLDRRKIGLKEITEEEYAEVMRSIFSDWEREEEFINIGRAEITEPLVYPDYQTLLDDFKRTKGARKASAKKWKKEWFTVKYDDFSDKNKIESLIYYAEKVGFIYLAFCHQNTKNIPLNNEVCFEQINRNERILTSTVLNIPGEDRYLYNWQGSSKDYLKIIGKYRIK